MSFLESVAGLAEYALHFNSNPRNIEPLWYGLWNEILINQREETDPSLRIYPQHPLTQWGVTRAESTVLTLNNKPRTPPPPDDELSDDDPEPLEIDLPKDRSYKGKNILAQDPFHIETRSRIPGASSESRPIFSLPSVFKTPERPPGGRKAEVPSSAETQALDRNRDSYFMLDFAVVKILAPKPPCYVIFGLNVQKRDAHIPIVLEAKRVPSRQFPGPSPELDFQHELHQMLLPGYDDVNRKVPVAFRCHPLQQSIIGIATCGHWWSFTIVSRTESKTTWSMCFVYGKPEHDVIFRSLFEAAADSSGDPAKYQNGRIKECLMVWKRTTYNKHDALATDRDQ